MEIQAWSEREYRLCKRNSFSSIKAYIDDRNKYYKKFILGQKVSEDDENTNEALRIGSLVDCLLFSPENLEEKFVTTSAVIPKKQMMDFVQNLYKRTLMCTREDGVVTRSLSDLIEDAYDDTRMKDGEIVAFKAKTLEKVKDEFAVKRIGYDYYLDLRNRGDKFVISLQELDNANKTVDILKNHRYTKDLINPIGKKALSQVILTGEYLGLEVKCMIDRVIIDEEKKIVYSYDLKTTWNVDQFEYNYIKYKYYLQTGLYTTMLSVFYTGYEVKPMSFIVVDKIGYMDPIIYTSSQENIRQGLEGFKLGSIQYTGVNQAIEDIKFHIQTGIWSSSAEVQRQNGLKRITI